MYCLAEFNITQLAPLGESCVDNACSCIRKKCDCKLDTDGIVLMLYREFMERISRIEIV